MTKVFLATNTGHLCVGRPLGWLDNSGSICETKTDIFQVNFVWASEKGPVAYALFVDDECHGIFSADAIKQLPLEDLGYL